MNKEKKQYEEWELLVLELKAKAQELGINPFQISKNSGLAPSTVTRVLKLQFCPTLCLFLKIKNAIK